MTTFSDIGSRIESYFDSSVVGPRLLSLGIALLLSVVVSLFLKRIPSRVLTSPGSAHSPWNAWFVELIKKTKKITFFSWFFLLILQASEKGTAFLSFTEKIVLAVTLLQLAIWGNVALRFWKETSFLKKHQEGSSAAAVSLVFTAVRLCFYAVLFLVGLSSFGIDIAALIAGLGIGGIAIALAAQNVLGDLLASLSIVLDKPFEVGDFVVVGNEKGTVESIGIKTTRLRSVDGEELIFSNKDLLESRIRNYKRMWERRVLHTFGLVYDTPPEKLEKVPTWIKAMVGEIPQLRFDRCHFSGYGSSALNFELVFWVTSADYMLYMDLQEKLFLKMCRKFAQEEVKFAFQSQAIHIKNVLSESVSSPERN